MKPGLINSNLIKCLSSLKPKIVNPQQPHNMMIFNLFTDSIKLCQIGTKMKGKTDVDGVREKLQPNIRLFGC